MSSVTYSSLSSPLFFFLTFPISFTLFLFFFFNDTATTEIYTLSLHDALPISRACRLPSGSRRGSGRGACGRWTSDRKSTRLNSSHQIISYAVFCLKKKKKNKNKKKQKKIS